MLQTQNSKIYDLEERTLTFARECRFFTKKLQKNISTFEDSKQLIRSSGSVGANYIEANEALSKKDFIMRIKIARKEAKESQFWLKLLDIDQNSEIESFRLRMLQEALELTKIFGSILEKSRF